LVVIIGAGTIVTASLITGGFVSVSFSLSPTVERLFELGSFDPFDVNIQTQESISITNFGGASIPIALAPSTTCADSTARMDVTITPAPCTGSTTTISRTGVDALFINSFSYSKDFQSFGQETWSLQGKPLLEDFTGSTVFIQGFAEGNQLVGTDIVSDDGVALTSSTGVGTSDASARNLQVSAGSPGLGQDDTQEFGKVTSIGGGVGKEDGKRGTASANVPHQLVFF